MAAFVPQEEGEEEEAEAVAVSEPSDAQLNLRQWKIN